LVEVLHYGIEYYDFFISGIQVMGFEINKKSFVKVLLYKNFELFLKVLMEIYFFNVTFILIILLIMLMSKGVILALVFVLLINLIQQKNIKIIYIISALVALVLFFVLIPEKNNRFKEIINLNTYETLDKNNSTSIRVMIYKCGIETLKKSAVLGYGIGDVQEKLDRCYSSNNSNFVKGMYNSHNQFLFIWLSTGILGFVVFIALLAFYFKKSIQYKDNIMFSVLMLYCIIFLFENVLSRQSGVIFFSFIVNYFLWDNFNRSNVVIEEKS